MAGKLLVSPGEEATEKVRFGNFEVMNDSEGRPVLLGKGTFGRTYQARHCAPFHIILCIAVWSPKEAELCT